MINFTHINYFIAIVEDGSISAASRRLFISQQALSEQLKRLETELNVTLFKRDKKLVLTPAGEHFYEGCLKMITRYNTLVEETKAMEDDRYRKITIGFPGFGFPTFLSEVAPLFLKKYPGYNLDFIKREHHDISLNLEDVDLYISSMPLADNLENHIILDDDPFVVTFRRSLAENVYGDKWPDIEKELIATKSLAPLKDMPFSLLFNSRKQLLHSTQLIFSEHDFNPLKKSFPETTQASDMLCLNGIAAIISPRSHSVVTFYDNPAFDTEGLVSYPIKITGFRTVLAISHLKNRVLHDAEEAFIQECREYFERLVIPVLPFESEIID